MLRGRRLCGNRLVGIGVGAKAKVELDGCEVLDNGGGLFIQGMAEIFRSSITENEGYGLGLVGDAKLTLMTSLIRGNKDGVVLWGRAQATLKQCLVIGNWYGIVLWEEA